MKDIILKALRENEDIASRISKSANNISGAVDRTKNQFKSKGVGDDEADDLAIASVVDAVKTEGVGDDHSDIGGQDIEVGGDDYEEKIKLSQLPPMKKKIAKVTKEDLDRIINNKLKK